MSQGNINLLFAISKFFIFAIYIVSIGAIGVSLFQTPTISSLTIGQYAATLIGFFLILRAKHISRLTRIILFLSVIPACTYAALNIASDVISTYLALITVDESVSNALEKTIQITSWYIPTFLLMTIIKNDFMDIDRASDQRKIPNIIYTVLQILIFAVPTLLVLSNVFGFKLTGLLATSGLLTAIIGFALQPNLSNIFSGIFINIDQPFRPTEWITVGDNTGKVIDVSWRSTRIRTFQNTEVTIPNETIAKSVITNWNRTDSKEMSEGFHIFISLSFHPHHDPEYISQLLSDALKRVKPVDGRSELDLQWVKFTDVDEYGLKFHVAFDCTNRLLKNSQENVVLLSIYKVMRHAGISMTTGVIEHFIKPDVGLGALEHQTRNQRDFQSTLSDKGNIYNEAIRNQTLLKQVLLFSNLPDDQIKNIADNSHRLHFSKDQAIIKQGDSDSRLFIIADGVIGIQLTSEDKNTTEIARLGVGEFFGEMALMTGEPRTADAIALRPSVVLVVEKETVKSIFFKNENFYNSMARILAERQIRLSKAQLLPEETTKEVSNLANKIGVAIARFFS